MFSPQKWEHMTPEQRKRNGRVIAVVLMFSTIISLAFLSYAFVEKSNAEAAKAEIEVVRRELQSKIVECEAQAMMARNEAERQRAMAAQLQEQKK